MHFADARRFVVFTDTQCINCIFWILLHFLSAACVFHGPSHHICSICLFSWFFAFSRLDVFMMVVYQLQNGTPIPSKWPVDFIHALSKRPRCVHFSTVAEHFSWEGQSESFETGREHINFGEGRPLPSLPPGYGTGSPLTVIISRWESFTPYTHFQ